MKDYLFLVATNQSLTTYKTFLIDPEASSVVWGAPYDTTQLQAINNALNAEMVASYGPDGSIKSSVYADLAVSSEKEVVTFYAATADSPDSPNYTLEARIWAVGGSSGRTLCSSTDVLPKAAWWAQTPQVYVLGFSSSAVYLIIYGGSESTAESPMSVYEMGVDGSVVVSPIDAPASGAYLNACSLARVGGEDLCIIGGVHPGGSVTDLKLYRKLSGRWVQIGLSTVAGDSYAPSDTLALLAAAGFSSVDFVMGYGQSGYVRPQGSDSSGSYIQNGSTLTKLSTGESISISDLIYSDLGPSTSILPLGGFTAMEALPTPAFWTNLVGAVIDPVTS